MRFDDQVVYPHPVLRHGTYDYRNSQFFDAIECSAPAAVDEPLVIAAVYMLDDPALKTLVAEGKAAVRLHVQCRWTLLHELIDLDPNGTTITLDPDKIHGKIMLHAVLCATENLKDFSSPDFAEDLQGMTFDIPVGSILGFCQPRYLYADREAFGSAESVIEIAVADCPVDEWDLDSEGDCLSILVSEETMAQISTMRSYPEGQAKLMAGLYAPAVQQAVEFLKRDGGENLLWKRVFRQRCMLNHIDLDNHESGKVTQLLLGNPLKSIFQDFKDNNDED